MNRPSLPPWRALDLCFCTLVLAFMVAPAIQFALDRGQATVSMAENRSAAEFPAAPKSVHDWARWPSAFEAWHNDHFGLRGTFVRANNLLKIWVLHTSPSPRIAVGPDHWVFTTGVDLEPWRGANPFSLLELDAWRESLESRYQEFKKRGIEFYFVLTPSKASIYPEFLPDKYRQGGPTRTDQLVEYLEKHSSFRVLDLRAPLLEEKRKDAGDDYTYFPLGIHWTERGALAGTRAIVAELAKAHPEVASVDDGLQDYVRMDEPGDSWAERLYLPDLLQQTVRHPIFRDVLTRPVQISDISAERTVTVDQADSSLPRAIVLHDSFGEPLKLMLGRHFSHSVFVWNPGVDLRFVDKEKPDVLIQLLNERVLLTLQPKAFFTEIDTRTTQQFEASREVVLTFDAAAPQIRAFGGASVALRTNGAQTSVACKTNTAADAFLLPMFKLRRGTHAVVRLEFESPIAGTTAVMFQTTSDRTYTRRRMLPYEIKQGHNTLYIAVLDPEFAGQLLFRPASEPGTFLVSGLEVRLVQD